jgi:hypothetical protein
MVVAVAAVLSIQPVLLVVWGVVAEAQVLQAQMPERGQQTPEAVVAVELRLTRCPPQQAVPVSSWCDTLWCVLA